MRSARLYLAVRRNASSWGMPINCSLKVTTVGTNPLVSLHQTVNRAFNIIKILFKHDGSIRMPIVSWEPKCQNLKLIFMTESGRLLYLATRVSKASACFSWPRFARWMATNAARQFLPLKIYDKLLTETTITRSTFVYAWIASSVAPHSEYCNPASRIMKTQRLHIRME